ncbi:MAG: DUF4126 domain-containing protein [Gemmatimonadota bacterium]|nr:DUF4126 domain-containing protein [Gemmatimonadota bacterium]
MSSLVTLAQSLCIAYATGISLYATVALVGLGERFGWIGPLPGLLGVLGNPIIIGVAVLLALVEFLATLIPGVASAWEVSHTMIRTPAAAALAIATAWHADPMIIALAGLLGGGLGLTTNLTKLGLRVAVDASPEPVSNGIVNTTELGIVAAMSYTLWQHPIAALGGALVILALTMLLVRAVWRAIRNLFRGGLRAGRDAAPS